MGLSEQLGKLTELLRENSSVDANVEQALLQIRDCHQSSWTEADLQACAELTHTLADSTEESQRIRAEDWEHRVTDLATTGGILLKSSVLVSTWLACSGFRVPKIASRGTDRTGTIDVLNSLGFRTGLTAQQLRQQVGELGLAFCDQEHFAPLDGRLMDLRRRTKTMNVAPLVISSILAKKMAIGLQRFCVEVRAGGESKFGDYAQTVEGAKLLVKVASLLGLDVLAIVSNGDLLNAHGVGPEILAQECLRHLEGHPETREGESGWVWDVAHRQALELFVLARWWGEGGKGEAPTRATLRDWLRQPIVGAREKFEEVGRQQGSNIALNSRLDAVDWKTIDVKEPFLVVTGLLPSDLKGLWKSDRGLKAIRIHVKKSWKPCIEFCGTLSELEVPSEWGQSCLPAVGVLGGWYSLNNEIKQLPLTESLLLATVGTSPGIVTETLDALSHEGTAVDRIVVVHTHDTKALKGVEELQMDLRPRLRDEFSSVNVDELVDRVEHNPDPKNRIPAPAEFKAGNFSLPERLPIAFFQPACEDVTDLETNSQTFTLLNRILATEAAHRRLWDYSQHLRVLTAGGRKTMSALAYFSAMLFDNEEVLHVLVQPPQLEKLQGSVYHLPPENVLLVRMPRMRLGSLLSLARHTLRQENGFAELDARQWERLTAVADEELQRLVVQQQQERESEQEARHRLLELLKNPLLPERLKLAFFDPEYQEQSLRKRLENELTGLADLEVVRELPQLDFASNFDAFVVTNEALKPNLLGFAQRNPIPLLSVTVRRRAEHRAMDRFLYQRSHAFHWVDAETLRHLTERLWTVIEGGSADERCKGEFSISGEQDPVIRDLVSQLFAGRALARLEMERVGAGAGWSFSCKYWISVDGKPRRYFVKTAPFQACFAEYLNYQQYISGFVDNFAGRIEWYPSRKGTTGAIAYTEIGSSSHVEMLSQRLESNLDDADAFWDSLVLKRLDEFHQRHQSKEKKIDEDLLRNSLNRYLPTRFEYPFCHDGGHFVEGRLVEVGQDKLQLVDQNGYKVNVKGIAPEHLQTLRLHLGRQLNLRCSEPRDLWADLLRKRKQLGFDDIVEVDQLWRPLLHRRLKMGIIHGDLNLDNLMLEYRDESRREAQQVWWVDFAVTGEGPLLFDYAKLEIELWNHIGSTVADRLGVSPQDLNSWVDRIYSKEGEGEAELLHRLLGQLHDRARQHDLGAPQVYDQIRAIYALNTLKYGNLDNRARRIAGALFNRFVRI